MFWSRFNIHFRLAEIYVTENRGEFLEKLQRARAQVKPNTPSQPVLSRPGQTRLVVGNWALASRKEGELHIHNSDGQQVVTVLQNLLCMQVGSSVSHTCMCVYLLVRWQFSQSSVREHPSPHVDWCLVPSVLEESPTSEMLVHLHSWFLTVITFLWFFHLFFSLLLF